MAFVARRRDAPRPAAASVTLAGSVSVPQDTPTECYSKDGAGWCDLIIFDVVAATNSHRTVLRVFCDGRIAFNQSFDSLNTYGCGASTPFMSLTKYAAAGYCCMVITKRFEFMRNLRVEAFNFYGAVTVSASVHPAFQKEL